MTFPEGISKGDNTAETPLTSTRLKRLAPITFPRERVPWPFVREVMAVTSSGNGGSQCHKCEGDNRFRYAKLSCDDGSVVYQKICTDGNDDSPYNQEENFFDKRGIFLFFSCGGSYGCWHFSDLVYGNSNVAAKHDQKDHPGDP